MAELEKLTEADVLRQGLEASEASLVAYQKPSRRTTMLTRKLSRIKRLRGVQD